MYKCQHAKIQNKTKTILVAISLSVIMLSIIGGSIAWLIASTTPIKNTFTYGDINISLDETKLDIDGNTVDENNDGTPDRTTEGNKYRIIPGNTVKKDPKVTFKANSENAWLFVKLDKSSNFDQFMEYEIILDDPNTTDVVEGWTKLEENVYYMAVDKAAADVEYFVIKDNTVKVKDSVTKEMLNNLDKNADGTEKTEKDYPTLTVTAYAVQRDNNIATAADAWTAITANN
ncbi:MAG: hypothetical protein J6K88_02970 [Oscillospiraceae bacterium]|nr:hypothetical protein [Oscillospiraceae bacterium]